MFFYHRIRNCIRYAQICAEEISRYSGVQVVRQVGENFFPYSILVLTLEFWTELSYDKYNSAKIRKLIDWKEHREWKI